MGDKITVISGTDYNINGIQRIGKLNDNSSAEVIRFNKFGYVAVKIYGRDKLVKRHLSDCEDIRSMTIGSSVQNLQFDQGRWIVVHNGVEIPSEEVYVVKFNNQCGEEVFVPRTTTDGYETTDITKAWFTFNKDQAVGYANKKSILNMRAYCAVSVDDIIRLQSYE